MRRELAVKFAMKASTACNETSSYKLKLRKLSKVRTNCTQVGYNFMVLILSLAAPPLHSDCSLLS